MRLVLRRAVPGRLSVGLAHIRAPLRVAIAASSSKVVNVRVLVHPNHGRSGTAGLSFLRGGELTRPYRSRCSIADGAGAGVGAAVRCHGNSEPVCPGAGAGVAAAPWGMVSLPVRHAATNSRLVWPEARIAALFTAYSASH